MIKFIALAVLLLTALKVVLELSERIRYAFDDYAATDDGDVVLTGVRWLDIIVPFALALGVLFAPSAQCGSIGSTPQSASRVSIPEASVRYRWQVYAASAGQFGVQASPARLAAQLHQESRWRPDARSAYAIGLAQFTPATADWLHNVCPEVGEFDPWDASQSIRAAACYDRWLYDQVSTAATECDRWAFTLSAYNGGLGWVRRDQKRASANGADAARWFGHVEHHTSRATWARDENRGYVRRILLAIEPAYIAAGWYGQPVCDGQGR